MAAAPKSYPGEGWRARKYRQTRRRIAEAALRLFLERGFENTTLEAIAEAAEISRRTFFHYFDSKQAILGVVDEDVEDAFRRALASSSKDRPFDAVHEALRDLISRYDSEDAIALDRLMRSTEGLRARKQAGYERQEQALFAALQAKWPQPERRDGLRAVAMIGIGAIRLAAEGWNQDGGTRPLIDHLERTLASVRAAMA